MKKLTIITIFAIIILANMYANTDKLLADLRAKYDTVKTFEADLNQTTFISALNITTNSSGILLIDNDVCVLEFTKPMRQFLKVEKNVLTMYLESENTAMIHDGFNGNFGIFNLSDFVNHQNEFEFLKEENGFSVFKVKKLREPNLKITMHINPTSTLIAKVIMEQASGELTTIELNNQRFNQKLSKKVSDYVVPNGATIIKN